MDGDYEVDSLGGLLAVATANAHNIEVGGPAASWLHAGTCRAMCNGQRSPVRLAGGRGRWLVQGR